MKSDAYIVLEFCIEKYRDITVERDDITPEEAQRIATMQSAHQSILEYTYQYTIAESTQERLSEICYTTFVTITSTLLVMGATWGLNKAFAGVEANVYANAASKSLTKFGETSKAYGAISNMAEQALKTSGRSLTFNMFKVTCAVITETLEELYVDPMIEAYVTNKVADMGGSEISQILLSGLAESGREQFLSSVTSFMRAGFDGRTQVDTNIQPSATNIENTIGSNLENRLAIQEAEAQQQLRQEYLKEGISTILMFTGAMAGGFGGSIGTALGNVMMVAGTSVEGIDSIKDMFEVVLKKEHIQPQKIDTLGPQFTDSLQAYVDANNWIDEDLSGAIEWAQLDQPQKQKQVKYEYVASNFDVWSDMVRQRSLLGMRPVGMHLSFKDENNFIGQRIKRELSKTERIKQFEEQIWDLYLDKIIKNIREDLGIEVSKDDLPRLLLNEGKISELLKKKDIMDLIGQRGRAKYGWIGFTYRWEIVENGVVKHFMEGLTTRTGKIRMEQYITTLSRGNYKTLYKSENPVKLSVTIYHFMESILKSYCEEQRSQGNIIHYKDLLISSNQERIHDILLDEASDLHLSYKITSLCWDIDALKQAERDVISIGWAGVTKVKQRMGSKREKLVLIPLTPAEIKEIYRSRGDDLNELWGRALNQLPGGEGLGFEGEEQLVLSMRIIKRTLQLLGLAYTPGRIYDELIDEGLLKRHQLKKSTFIQHIREQFGPIHEIHKIITFPSYNLFLDQYGRKLASEQYWTFLSTVWYSHIGKAELSSKIPFLFQLMIDGVFHMDEIVPKVQITKTRIAAILESYYSCISTDLSNHPKDPVTYVETFGVDSIGSYLKVHRYFTGIKALGLVLEGKDLNWIADSFSDNILFDKCKDNQERLEYLDLVFEYFFGVDFVQVHREFHGKLALKLINDPSFLRRFRLNHNNDISIFARNHILSVAFNVYRNLRDLFGPFLPFFS